MTQLEIVLLISLLVLVPLGSGAFGYFLLRKRAEAKRQSRFEAKLKDMLTERNKHLSKLVESLLLESLEMIKEEISDADYREGRLQAMKVVEETNKAIRLLEERDDSSSIANMTVLQNKLQEMVDNLDGEIVARQEETQEEVDYKTLN